MTAMWTAGGIYVAALALLLVVVKTRGSRPMLRTMLAILGWFVGANAWTLSHGGGEPWALFFALDVVCALVVLIAPAGRMQSVIGTTFLVKLAMDTGYGLILLNGGTPDDVTYWWSLTTMGFVQLLLVGGWWASERYPSAFGLRRIHRFDRAARNPGVA